MKKKLSVSIEEDVLDKLQSKLQDRAFRNKSHIVEYALNKYLKEAKNE